VKPRRSRDVVQVRVPADQAPLFHIPGPHGGWFASLLFGYPSVDVPMRGLRELIAGSHGEVIVARRLTHEEADMIEGGRVDCDAGVHARIIATEEERFRRPRRRDKHGRRRSDAGQR
jgi:hypothetical protein